MRIKMVDFTHIARVQAVASMLLLSSCGGGNSTGSSAGGDLADDDCTSTINLSTQLVTEVDINGNISMVPVANNTISSDCGSPVATDALRQSLVETRFENTDDFDVWNCTRADGSSRQYALVSYDVFGHINFEPYGFLIDPDADDPVASQQFFNWIPPLSITEDVITFTPRQRIGLNDGERTDSEWTGITFATADDISFTSSTEGPMQCNRIVSAVDLDGRRFFVPCDLRGPSSLCE